MKSKHFIIIGLIFNLVGVLILLYPLLDTNKNIRGDYIVKMNKETGDYTQIKHFSDRSIGLWGLSFIAYGFIFQMLGTLWGGEHNSFRSPEKQKAED